MCVYVSVRACVCACTCTSVCGCICVDVFAYVSGYDVSVQRSEMLQHYAMQWSTEESHHA